ACVDVLGVLAEDDHIDILRILDRGRYAIEVPDRPNAREKVQLLSERDVERADAAAYRCRERTLDAYVEFPDGFKGIVGEPCSGLFECLFAGEYLEPYYRFRSVVGVLDTCVKDPLCGAPDIRADA